MGDKIKGLEGSKEALEGSNRALENKAKTSRGKIENLEAENKTLKDNTTTLQTQLTDQTKVSDIKVKGLEDKIKGLEKNLKKSQEKTKGLEENLKKSQEEVIDSSRALPISKTESQSQDKGTGLRFMPGANSQLFTVLKKNAYKEVEDDIGNLQKKIDDLEAEKKHWGTRIRAENQEQMIADRDNEIKKLTGMVEGRNQELLTKISYIKTLEADSTKKGKFVQELERKYKAHRDRTEASLKAINQDLEDLDQKKDFWKRLPTALDTPVPPVSGEVPPKPEAATGPGGSGASGSNPQDGAGKSIFHTPVPGKKIRAKSVSGVCGFD